MKMRLLFVVAATLLLPSLAAPQALTSLSSLRVRYSTLKASVRPTGDLATQIDIVDRELAVASRLGRTGEVRRLLAKGTALLSGRAWTPEADYTASVVIRSSAVVFDSGRPHTLRLEQIFSPSIELSQTLRAKASLREAPLAGAAAAGRSAPVVVKDLGGFDGVARDLRESPFAFEVDASGVEDGPYQLAVEVAEGERPLGTVTLPVYVRKGLDALVASIEAAAAAAPADVRADILYPVDRMRQVNRGALELRTFDPAADFAAAQQVAAAVKAGRHPFKGRTGDFKRHYRLEVANEIMPYRMYVPAGYDGSRAYPLIVALHGLGGTEDSFFENYDRAFPPLAERHGYIVAAPLGYRVDGFYGWGVGAAPADPDTRRLQERSERDVMEVLARVRQEYTIDPSRIYLAGHSMGAIGTWRIAARYPDIWAAIGAFSGQGQPASMERMTHLPQFVVHGDNDPTVNVRGSREMVAKGRELGVRLTYIEVPGGTHGSVVAPHFPALFEFFNEHRRPATAGQP